MYRGWNESGYRFGQTRDGTFSHVIEPAMRRIDDDNGIQNLFLSCVWLCKEARHRSYIIRSHTHKQKKMREWNLYTEKENGRAMFRPMLFVLQHLQSGKNVLQRLL